MYRSPNRGELLRMLAVFPLLICLAVSFPGVASAQTSGEENRTLKPLVTDRNALAVSSRLANMPAETINARGDYLYNLDATGVFLRRAGAAASVRLFQSGDTLPGIPHTRIERISDSALSETGVVAVALTYAADGTTKTAIYRYDESGFHYVAASGDPAPGAGGDPLGYPLYVHGFDAAGNLVIQGNLTRASWPQVQTQKPTLFLARPSGEIVRLAGYGDTVPGTAGTIATVTVSGRGAVNAGGSVLFTTTMQGGATGTAICVASVNGLRKIAAPGDDNLLGGAFAANELRLNGVSLSDSNQVLFGSSSALYLAAGDSMTVVATRNTVASGAANQAYTLSSVNTPWTLGNNGSVLFYGRFTNNKYGLTSYGPDGARQVVLFAGDPAPGTSGQTFSSGYAGLSIDDAGDISFYAPLLSGPASGGLFSKKAGGSLSAVVLNGQAAPIAGGGTYHTVDYSYLLHDGSLYFDCYIDNGAATYGAFLKRGTADPESLYDALNLPPGATMSFAEASWPAAAGHFVTFPAELGGGAMTAFLHDLQTGVTQKVVAAGDAVPGGNLTGVNARMYVNRRGSVAFSGSVPTAGGGSVCLWTPDTKTIQRLAGLGDTDARGGVIRSLSSLGTYSSPLNDSDQVVFQASVSLTAPPWNVTALYVAAPGQQLVPVLATGDVLESVGKITSLSSWRFINSRGDVAVTAMYTTPNSTTAYGVFVKLATSATAQLVWTTTAAMPKPTAMDNQGRVLFFAADAAGSTNLMLASPGGDVQTVAAWGGAAPGGGTYAFAPNAMDAKMNERGDIVFHAPLAGGGSNSGLFMRRASTGAVEAIARQGQAAPGTSGVFTTLPPSLNQYPGEFYAVGPTGQVLLVYAVDFGDKTASAAFRYRAPGVLEKALGRGDAAPNVGGGTIASISQSPAVADDGTFILRGSVIDGAVGDVIYGLAADATPPVLTLPSAVAADATSLSGANVTYAVSAVDDVDGPVAVTCTPASGSLFAIGDTTVVCSAVDAAGNSASGSFVVHVRGQSEQAQDLLTTVESGALAGSLGAKVTAATTSLAASSTTAACGQLNAAANEVRAQSGKKLTAEQAAALLADIARIGTLSGCK